MAPVRSIQSMGYVRQAPKFQTCEHCGLSLPEGRRADQRFCPKVAGTASCKDLYHNARLGKSLPVGVLTGRGTVKPSKAELWSTSPLSAFDREDEDGNVVPTDAYSPMVTAADPLGQRPEPLLFRATQGERKYPVIERIRNLVRGGQKGPVRLSRSEMDDLRRANPAIAAQAVPYAKVKHERDEAVGYIAREAQREGRSRNYGR